ncbi:hypothetical protein MKY80_12950 [Lysinibacillus sp. FSL R5-0849]|uniref:hypothetical protein n=1 Tax=Lysinibacillus TaxID=400634 RepID=UPI000B7D68E4|nr:hypothetical protein [Lysinibacillus fusiformis]QAS56268.1 hypothetical protein LSP_07735 [Lysinibacillus sphaericus]HAU35587.1 hypothetical protein [Lysinibacillus sp.]NOG26722.1 hypothetical protein [Lysinibacillus fusiformis]RDV24712.1 hypothetical protein C7B90_23690 [Lysinibacillus fusiformis]GED65507.1 hypothetical protein LFU01_39590 [Lysinibacillus fusiformis]
MSNSCTTYYTSTNRWESTIAVVAETTSQTPVKNKPIMISFQSLLHDSNFLHANVSRKAWKVKGPSMIVPPIHKMNWNIVLDCTRKAIPKTYSTAYTMSPTAQPKEKINAG